jgi:hypothetical protein
MSARVDTRCSRILPTALPTGFLAAFQVALLAGLLVALAPVSLRAQAPRVFTELDTALVSVGDRMALTVRVEHDPAATVIWPDSLALDPLEVLGAELAPPLSEGGRSITSASFTLAAFELGDLEIPSFDVRVDMPDGSSNTLSTDRYVITVQSVGLDEGGDIRAIRGPLGLPLSVVYVLPWVLLLVLLGGLGYWLWVKRRRPEASPRRSVVIPRFPHEDAREALDRLEASDLLERGEIKEYHILASEIIRTYVEGRYGVYALEMTTGEVVEGLRSVDLPEDAVQAFVWFASRCDLVKFARLRPAPVACREVLQAARAFVERTQPREDPFDAGPDSDEAAPAGGDPELIHVGAASEREDREPLEPASTPVHGEGG